MNLFGSEKCFFFRGGGGHEAMDTKLAYTPVSQAYGHRYNSLNSLSALFFLAALQCKPASAKYCLEFTIQGGYRMCFGLSGSALPPPNSTSSLLTLHTGRFFLNTPWIAGQIEAKTIDSGEHGAPSQIHATWYKRNQEMPHHACTKINLQTQSMRHTCNNTSTERWRRQFLVNARCCSGALQGTPYFHT